MTSAPDAALERKKIRMEKRLEAEESVRAAKREIDRLRHQHLLELETGEESTSDELLKAKWATENELNKLFHQTMADVIKGTIDRSRDSAKFLQTAAAAIAAIYTGLLGLVFSVTSNPLPLRGAYAAIFLGLAVAFATAYLAFIKRSPSVDMYKGGASLSEMQLMRTGYLSTWVNSTVHSKRWAMRASVFALAFGVAMVAAPFVTWTRPPVSVEAPVPPPVPPQIASEVAGPAAEIYALQAASYKAELQAYSRADSALAAAKAEYARQETRLNVIFTAIAVFGLVVVLVAPLIYSDSADKERTDGGSRSAR